MRTPRLLLLLPVAVILACTDPIPTDTLGDPATTVPAPAGVIRGSVLYQGPRPCSTGGHIVGSAVVLLFDQNNPPPPNGLANTAVNFTEVPGDVLFANEPRWGGSDTYCPAEHGFDDTITASAPFAVSPLAPAAYIIEAFYDSQGHFIPTFKFRNLPEQGDVGGGDIDTADALKPINAVNPDYQPVFLPVGVGIPQPVPAGSPPGTVPLYTMPTDGFLADNVQVTMGEVLSLTRPYVYAQGIVDVPDTITTMDGFTNATRNPQPITQSSDAPHTTGDNAGITGSVDLNDPNYAPVLTVPQDIQTFAPPVTPLVALSEGADLFELGGTDANGVTAQGFPHLRLMFGVGSASTSIATSSPFDMQIKPFNAAQPASGGGINQWIDEVLPPGGTRYLERLIPEGGNFPNIWPQVILAKLEDDPTHTKDPASLTTQGSATAPVVLIEGITLSGGLTSTASTNADGDSVFSTVSAEALTDSYVDQATGNPIVVTQDHLTTMLRPAAICFDSLFDPNTSDKRGIIVAPLIFNDSADTQPTGMSGASDPIVKSSPLVPVDLLDNTPASLFVLGRPVARAQVSSLVKPPPGWVPGTPPAMQGCIPPGRYEINVVYPDGQAWTVPNEAGACTGVANGEGTTNWNSNPISCSIQPRPVIRSQGPRAVVEVVASTTGFCKAHPVPSFCLPH